MPAGQVLLLPPTTTIIMDSNDNVTNSDDEDNTSSSNYTTESSSSSSSDDDDGVETAEINSTRLQLPQGLCDRKDLFMHVFSIDTWNSLSPANKQHLQTFLPNFPQNDDREKSKTLERLFSGAAFKFTSPLGKFHDDLKAGYFRPDIARMRRFIKKAERKEANYRYRRYRAKLKEDLVEMRAACLRQVASLPPGIEPKLDKLNNKQQVDYVAHRTKRRYCQTLASIQAQVDDNFCSTDETYPEGPPVSLSRKQRRHLNSIRSSSNNKPIIPTMYQMRSNSNGLDLEKYITPLRNPFYVTDEGYRALISEHKRRKLNNPDDPELNTKGIHLIDIVNKTQLPYIKNLLSIVNNTSNNNNNNNNNKFVGNRRKIKKGQITFNTQSPELFSKNNHHNTITTSSNTTNSLFCGGRISSNSESDSDSFIDAVSLNHLNPKSRTVKTNRTVTATTNNNKSLAATNIRIQTPKIIKTEILPPLEAEIYAGTTTTTTPPPVIKIESLSLNNNVNSSIISVPSSIAATNIVAAHTNTSYSNKPIMSTSYTAQYGKITPVTLSDLEGIDMMNIPIDLDNSDIDILELNNKPELMQETHSNYLSLIRDIICSTNEHRMNMSTLEERLKSWQENPISPLNDWYSLTDNWVALVQSAVNFLCGNSTTEQPPDDFVPYMEYKLPLDMYQWIGAGRDSDALLAPLCQYWLEHRTDNNKSGLLFGSKDSDSLDLEVTDRSQTPPPPRCPTTWTVRKATAEEVLELRDQERRRYDNPHKAFTYRCNGYESVVGPLKGIYNPAVGNNAKARGHTMLSADRPNFVTILSLVRDATARLPNGEGTRADICELLKSSQYISSTAPENVLQSVVSGALDRMHTQFDSCVKYDPKRKIWIYLHRNRTEEDFERIHQQYQGINKSSKKTSTSAKKASSKTRPPKPEKLVKTVIKTTGGADSPIQSILVDSKNSKIIKTKTMMVQQVNNATINSNSNSSSGGGGGAKLSSLLLSNNLQKSDHNIINTLSQVSSSSNSNSSAAGGSISIPYGSLDNKSINPQQNNSGNNNSKIQSQEEKEINEALQAIVQNRVGSPIITKQLTTTTKGGKSLVKIITPSPGGVGGGQGKSLIIPAGGVVQRCNTPTMMMKHQQQVTTQQLLQMAAAQQQKQTQIQIIQKTISDTNSDNKLKVPVTIQQQFNIQSITPQQLQNIKNVTLVRSLSQGQGQSVALTPVTLTSTSSSSPATTAADLMAAIKANAAGASAEQLQIKTQLTPGLIQTIKQKMLPQQQQQQTSPIILKQKAVTQLQKQQQGGGTSLLGQAKLTTGADGTKTGIGGSQNPVVAKVLTNAAGQVISVESLLAHQKQHGSLPQGTTLRVSGTKAGQTNIIQLTGTSKANTITQFAVASQNNLITLTSQPKLVVSASSLAGTAATTATMSSTASPPSTLTRTLNKTQTITKFPPKVAQQLINAKLITQNLDGTGQKLVQPKLYVGGGGGQTNQVKLTTTGGKNLTSKPVTISVAAAGTANTIRMVNAANLNLTHIGGKPILLASKGNTIQNIQGQNVILQSSNTGGSGTNSLVLQNSTTTKTTQQQNLMLGQQLKMQPTQVVFSNSSNTSGSNNSGAVLKTTSTQLGQQNISQGHIMLGGHPVRLQTTNSPNATQRVVVASQGQGGQIVAQQILLPAGFQGTAINIKALQGVKVIPIAQATAHAQSRGGVQGRQMFARVMNPNIVKTALQSSSASSNNISNNSSSSSSPISNVSIVSEKVIDPTIPSSD